MIQFSPEELELLRENLLSKILRHEIVFENGTPFYDEHCKEYFMSRFRLYRSIYEKVKSEIYGGTSNS